MKTKSFEDVQEYVIRISKRNNWQLNSEQDSLNNLIQGLQVNFNRFGYYNCPCRDSQEDPQLDRDIICPCRYAEMDIAEYGYCYCSLYCRKDFEQKHPLKMIPERRSTFE
ncbi:MAG: ferredoxin-thioredoxin reductase catalytic domain-containing protein [Candidatus Hodarchaeota archaeon]